MGMIRATGVTAAVVLGLALPAAAQQSDLVIGIQLEPPVLDPTINAAAAIGEVTYDNVFEGLTRIEEDGSVVPALATDWSVSDDGLTYVFHLRQGVTFHDGTTFDADDVAFTFGRLLAAESPNPQKALFAAVDDVVAVDPATVEFRLSQRFGDLLYDLSWPAAVIVAPESEGANALTPVGTGPFRFVEWAEGDHVTLARYDGYWGEAPALATATFRFISEPATAANALRAGDVDAFPNFPAYETVPLFQNDRAFTVAIGATEGEVIMSINNAAEPFDDLRVRQAISHAVDRQTIIDGAVFGYGIPIGSFFSPGNAAYVDLTGVYPYDPARARALLAEAGYPDGFSFSFLCRNTEFVNEEQICQAVSAMWARIGLRPNLNLGPTTIQDAKFDAGQFDVGTLGWANEPMIDSYSILVQVVHSKTGNAGVFNWGGWKDAEIDALIDKAGATVDRDERLAMQAKALLRANELSMFIPVHQQPMAWATGANIESVLQLSDNKPRHWLTRMTE